MKKSFYLPVTSYGGIPEYFTNRLRNEFCNDEARSNLKNALDIGIEKLQKYNIFILAYGDVDIYFFNMQRARNVKLKDSIRFINHSDYLKFQGLDNDVG